MTRLILRPNRAARLLSGGRTVYAGDVARIEGRMEPGCEAEVVTAEGRPVGRGLCSPGSKQLLRLLTRGDELLDHAFFADRLERAWHYRQLLGETECCRVVHGDADWLPGLTVDKYGEVLSLQTLTAGMEQRLPMLCDLLEALLHPIAIYERNDVKVREREGLPQRSGLLRGSLPTPLLVRENGFLLEVDVLGGQKTGSYLDQRENHAAIAPYVKGKRVLDACCHTGGFGLHAAGYGAAQVTACDISEQALVQARANYERNGLTAEFVQDDVFELLRRYRREGRQFDVIILDPPAFCKNRSALEGALRGYKDINLNAMALLPPGGTLVTCSCSHHVTPELFYDMLRQAADDAGVSARVVEQRLQSRDHPILLEDDGSLYLKCAILQMF